MWSPFDFIIAFALLVATGLIYQLGIKRVKNRSLRLTFTVAVLAVLLLVWVELAVGIFH